MAESTLSMPHDDLQSRIGYFLGYGRTSGNWDTEQDTNVDESLKGGLRYFYWNEAGHDWSFMRPTISLVTWGAKTGYVKSAVDGTNKCTIVVDTASTFYPTSEGQTFTSNGTDFTILKYISGTSVELEGTQASSLYLLSTNVNGDPVYTLGTDTSTVELASGSLTTAGVAVGDYVYFTTTTLAAYEITAITDATNFVVSGNAELEGTDTDPVQFYSSFSVAAGDYRMPDNFGSFIGDWTYPNNSGLSYYRVAESGEQSVRRLRQNNNATGKPIWFGTVPVNPTYNKAETDPADGAGFTRYDVRVWPTPDQDYTMTARINILPDTIATNDYPYGGAAHAETLIACCLAAADELVNDRKGEKWDLMQRRLAWSIARDKRDHTPEYFGYNDNRNRQLSGKRSDMRTASEYNVTVNGVEY